MFKRLIAPVYVMFGLGTMMAFANYAKPKFNPIKSNYINSQEYATFLKYYKECESTYPMTMEFDNKKLDKIKKQ